MIQINPEILGDRAAALLLLEKLREEAERIHAEIERLTRELNAAAGSNRPRLFDNPQR